MQVCSMYGCILFVAYTSVRTVQVTHENDRVGLLKIYLFLFASVDAVRVIHKYTSVSAQVSWMTESPCLCLSHCLFVSQSMST